ncbi:MAG: 30S ribosomal protein S6 [Nitrospirae bacterium]|nr:MAG: 30S ribosomal protein S6 [Nitrospirota bacterium]
MDIYENIIIFNASLSDEDIETASGKIKDLITSSGGEILKVDVWGRRKLAYEIQKQNKGFYLLLFFKSPSAAIRKLEDYYKVFDPVMKYMVLKLGQKQIDAALPAAPVAAAGAAVSGEKAAPKSEA